MLITINGERQDVPEGVSIAGLLTHLGLDAARLAIEMDRKIVKRQNWEQTPVAPGSSIEIVQFVGGG